MVLPHKLKILSMALAVLLGAACASKQPGLPFRDATITASRQAMRPHRDNATGAAQEVRYSQVAFRDDATGDEFRGALDGGWIIGAKLRFYVAPDGQIIVR